MESKSHKSWTRRAGSLITALLLVFTVAFSPMLTPRAHAILGVGDFGFDIEDVVKFVLDAMAADIAQRMVDDIVKSTIDWANSGFEGGPAYVTEPGDYFTNLANGAVGEFINGSELGFLCSPFKNNIVISLRNQYYQPVHEKFQCTLDEVAGNITDFYENFDSGGWDSWFALTQTPTNNPYGAYIEAKIELNSRIQRELDQAEKEYTINQGFLSVRECAVRNVDIVLYNDLQELASDSSFPLVGEYQGQKYDLTKQANECLEQGQVTSAGATIKSQLDRVLPSGLERLISAEHMEQLVGAFATGLLKRTVFSDEGQGLFGANTANSYARELIDVEDDEDKIIDGYDTNGDGNLDICAHGLKPKPGNISVRDWKPSNENCNLSDEVTSSPFFIPICEKMGKNIKELEKFLDFLERNEFKDDNGSSIAFLNRYNMASGAIDDLTGTLGRYDAPEFNKTLFALGKYSKEVDKDISSLAKDGDLSGSTGGDNKDRENMIKNTREVLGHLRAFNATLENRCADPNLALINNLPQPDIIVSPDRPANNPQSPSTPEGDTLSCSADFTSRPVGASVRWSVQSNLSSSYEYEWSLDGDANTISTSDTSITVNYEVPGTKSAVVRAVSSSGAEYMVSACVNPVLIYGEE